MEREERRYRYVKYSCAPLHGEWGSVGGCQVEEGVREWRRGGCRGSGGGGGWAQTKMVKWHNKDEQLTVFCRSFRSIVYIQTAAAGSPLISISPSPCLSLRLSLSPSLCLPFSWMGVTRGAALGVVCARRELAQQNTLLQNCPCAANTPQMLTEIWAGNQTDFHSFTILK